MDQRLSQSIVSSLLRVVLLSYAHSTPDWSPLSHREVIQPDVMEEMVVSCVIKHLNLVDALQSLINFQYQEEHAEEYDLLCKIMGETFKKLNAMERQLQVSEKAGMCPLMEAASFLAGSRLQAYRLPVLCCASMGMLCFQP